MKFLLAILIALSPEIAYAQAIAIGQSHVCAISPTGGVRCAGNNRWGQLGDGTTTSRSAFVDVVGLKSGALAVVAGSQHTCALVDQGAGKQVRCWGDNSRGQLGFAAGDFAPHPLPVTTDLTGIDPATLSSGDYHACIISALGFVACWGGNDAGQVGDGTLADQGAPVALGLFNGEKATDLALGTKHTCARVMSGNVVCWGGNDHGQLGRNTSNETVPYLAKPIPSFMIVQGMLAGGGNHNCAATSSNVAKCWGENSNGQLGDGSTTSSSVPIGVLNPLGLPIVRLAAGASHSCFDLLAVNGRSVRCWGANFSGQLGNASFFDSSSPSADVAGLQQPYSELTASHDTTCVIGGQDTPLLRCWGDNFDGQFGNNSVGQRVRPVELDISNGLSTVTMTSLGAYHSCAVIGGVFVLDRIQCWGANESGELGDGTQLMRALPVPVTGSGNAATISAGAYHSCIADATGAPSCWGYNSSGQVGNNSFTDQASPARVTLAFGSHILAGEIASGAYHSCAVTADGVQCWGNNDVGQLGNGSLNGSPIPIVIPLAQNASGNVVAAGADHSCAITQAGEVQCWGSNDFGQLGVPGGARLSATHVDLAAAGDTATEIVAGSQYTCALIASSGQVQCWGFNGYGQLGTVNTVDKPTPTPVAGLQDVIHVSASSASLHTCAITLANELYCWGANFSGQLGDGTTDDRATPEKVALPEAVASVSVGAYHTCATLLSGKVMCWGDNAYGQLGIGEHGFWPQLDTGVNLDVLFDDGFETRAAQ